MSYKVRTGKKARTTYSKHKTKAKAKKKVKTILKKRKWDKNVPYNPRIAKVKKKKR